MVSRKKLFLLVLAGTLLCPPLLNAPALAHEGHGHSQGHGHTLTHYLTEPLHLLQFAAVAVAAFTVGWLAARKWGGYSAHSACRSTQ